jgi:hypothetical protein
MRIAQRLHLVHATAFSDRRPALTIQIDEKGTLRVDADEPDAWLAAVDDDFHHPARFPIAIVPRAPEPTTSETPFRRSRIEPTRDWRSYSPRRAS